MTFDTKRLLVITTLISIICIHECDTKKAHYLPMKQKLQPTQKNKDIDLMFILDDSGSITDQDFFFEGEACATVLSHFDNPGLRYAVMTFSTRANIIQSFTSDRASILKAIHDAPRYRGSTSITRALQLAKQHFHDSGRKDAEKIVFLLTDGEADTDPFDIAASLRFNENVLIIVAGVGEANGDKLKQIASIGQLYLAKDFESLVKMLKDKSADNTKTHPRELSFRVFLKTFPASFLDEELQLSIVMRNEGREEIQSGFHLYFEAETFLDSKFGVSVSSPLPPHGNATIDVSLPIKPRVSAQDLPEIIKISALDHNYQPIFSSQEGFSISTEEMVGSLTNWIPSDPSVECANVLVFGGVGAGKSSFINSVLTMLSNQVQHTAVTGGTGGHSTREIVQFRLWNLHGIPKIFVNFWDTWGVTPTNYDHQFMVDLLTGKIPEGFKMSERLNASHSYHLNSSEQIHEMHAALIVVSQSFRFDDALVANMQKYFETISQHGLNPLVVVTYMDDLEPSEYLPIRKSIADIFKVGIDRIYLVTNQVLDGKNFEEDKKRFQILENAINLADQRIAFVKARNQKHASDVVHDRIPPKFAADRKTKEAPQKLEQLKPLNKPKDSIPSFVKQGNTEFFQLYFFLLSVLFSIFLFHRFCVSRPTLPTPHVQEEETEEGEDTEDEEQEKSPVREESSENNNNSEPKEENNKEVEVVYKTASKTFAVDANTTFQQLRDAALDFFQIPQDEKANYWLADTNYALLLPSHSVLPVKFCRLHYYSSA